ncbi:hypothetical protein [Solibaculum mannosilyticum]|uniref:hypothetical protein n=1 Tax=Solibaculum mannosilyticum TaxID=2780922 RepID=UPI0007A92967|nr:hypothetical protein BN3661_01007 [Eubacteriaceae bacterium CHKCI005]
MKRAAGYLYYAVLIAAVPVSDRLFDFVSHLFVQNFALDFSAMLLPLFLFFLGAYLFCGRWIRLTRLENLICKLALFLTMLLFSLSTLSWPRETSVSSIGPFSILSFLLMGYSLFAMMPDIIALVHQWSHYCDKKKEGAS